MYANCLVDNDLSHLYSYLQKFKTFWHVCIIWFIQHKLMLLQPCSLVSYHLYGLNNVQMIKTVDIKQSLHFFWCCHIQILSVTSLFVFLRYISY